MRERSFGLVLVLRTDPGPDSDPQMAGSEVSDPDPDPQMAGSEISDPDPDPSMVGSTKKGELRGKRGEIPQMSFFEEGNFRRGIFGGQSSQWGIFEEGNFPGGESSLRGMFGGECSEGNFR